MFLLLLVVFLFLALLAFSCIMGLIDTNHDTIALMRVVPSENSESLLLPSLRNVMAELFYG